MLIAGGPVGRRKLVGAALVVVGVIGFAVATIALGKAWGLILIGAALGLTLLTAGATFFDSGRLRSGQCNRYDQFRRSITSAAQTVAASLEKLSGSEPAITSSATDATRLDAVLNSIWRTLEEATASIHDQMVAIEAAQQEIGHTLAYVHVQQPWWSEPPQRPTDVDAEVELIRRSGFFDHDWYRRQAGSAGEDPVRDYVARGAALGLGPHPLFAPAWYLDNYPDALRGWRTPLAHFLSSGEDPHPAFWSRWYANRYLGEGGKLIPVLHFLREGANAGFNPNPLVDIRWYRAKYRGIVDVGINPLVHYLTVGAGLDLDPSPLFRTADVRRRVGATSGDPLSTFFTLERRQRLATSKIIGSGICSQPSEDDRRWEYLARGLYHEPDTFVLYRIIGNDLPPRHREGQSLENLRFILKHEPVFPGCQKRWVVNRIVDPEQEKEIISLLEAHGVPYLHIPFLREEYQKAQWRFAGLPLPGFTYRREFDELGQDRRRRILDHLYHDKNLYVMNNNGARNAALRQGRQLAKWVLPWDGNCFITSSAWSEIVSTIRERPYLKYFSVPMARVLDNEILLEPGVSVDASEEPQVVFRRDAEEQFDPDARYGYRPKIMLLNRLGVAGPWDNWTRYPWEPMPPRVSPQAGPVGRAGWVARLFSGHRHLEADLTERGVRRAEAVWQKINDLDATLARGTFDADALFMLDELVLEQQRRRYEAQEPEPFRVITDLISEAEESLGRPPYSVIKKTSLPPSGDPHDYWHPAPYFWPNPDTPDGLPFVYRDGERVPGTRLWEPGSEQYDRSSLQSMINESWYVALAGYFTDDARFHSRGAELLRTWFLDPETRMNPHLEYAQVRKGHNNDRGSPAGIIEAKDFYFLLDAARLLERSGALSGTDARGLREWFSEYRTWLDTSAHGRAERGGLNNHGTWYDVQMLAIDAYLNNLSGLLLALRRSHERVGQQFEPDGRQPEELRRTITQHYCAYNLQGWVALATGATRVGQDLWTYRNPDGAGIGVALKWLLRHNGRPWPYQQIGDFDPDRLRVLGHEASAAPSLKMGTRYRTGPPDPWLTKQTFTPHEGIRPFWLLGSRADAPPPNGGR